MTTIAPPICYGCTRLHPTANVAEPMTCDAFPDAIPQDILFSKVDHREPVAGDNGMTFDPKDEKAAQYAELLFSE